MSKTCAQRKKERDRDRQRDYVGSILMDNRDLYRQMQFSGFPVTVSLREATSGDSQKWEEEKQAYLNCEKVALAEAINYFGSDVILDLTSAIVTTPCCVDEDPVVTVVVQESAGTICSAEINTIDELTTITVTSTKHEIPHQSLNSRSRRVIVDPVATEDVTDLPAEGNETQMVSDQHGYLGSYLSTIDTLAYSTNTECCTSACGIPLEVLNVMVREDPKLAQRCQIIKKTVNCGHLDGLQSIEKPDVPVYDMQTLTMGKVANERGFRYYDYFTKIRPRSKDIPLSPAAWHFLHTLSDKRIASRALGNVLRFTQNPGLRTTILYNWNSGAPKHELFPLRFSS